MRGNWVFKTCVALARARPRAGTCRRRVPLVGGLRAPVCPRADRPLYPSHAPRSSLHALASPPHTGCSELALGLHWSLRLGALASAGGGGAGGASGGHHGGGRGHSIAAQLGLRPAMHTRLQNARELLICHFTLWTPPPPAPLAGAAATGSGGGAQPPPASTPPTIDARKLAAATGLPMRLLKPLLESLCVRTSLGASGPGGEWRRCGAGWRGEGARAMLGRSCVPALCAA